MDSILEVLKWILLVAANVLLGYLGVARSNYLERNIREKNGKGFISWLPEFYKEIRTTIRGGVPTEKKVGGKVVTGVTEPDRSMIFPFIFIAAFGGIFLLLTSSSTRKNEVKSL
jgi:hypothetical protein